MSACNFSRNVWQDPQCQAVYHDRSAVRYLQQKGSRSGPGRLIWRRKSFADVEIFDIPYQLPEFRDDPPVIAVATGWRIETAWHREDDALHHNGASYCARAWCDLERAMSRAL